MSSAIFFFSAAILGQQCCILASDFMWRWLRDLGSFKMQHCRRRFAFAAFASVLGLRATPLELSRSVAWPDLHVRFSTPEMEASPGDARRRGHAAANFEAAGQNELPVRLGDVLEILESHPTGWSWARSVSGGNCGWVPSWIVPEADTSAAAASALLATGQAAAPEVRLPRPRRLSGEPDERMQLHWNLPSSQGPGLRLAERLAADARQLRLYLPVGGAGPGGTVPAVPGVYASEKKKQQEWDAVSKDTAGATQQKPLTTATAKPQKRTQASAASDKVPQAALSGERVRPCFLSSASFAESPPCLEGQGLRSIRSDERYTLQHNSSCTASCLPGYVPNFASLYCWDGALTRGDKSLTPVKPAMPKVYVGTSDFHFESNLPSGSMGSVCLQNWVGHM
ncbi:unnamed protein product [Effrenium voratum]|nr:unnamed protein product [Effrenium voratum]